MDKGLVPKCNIAVYAAGTPDSLGNRIYDIQFMQNGTESWETVACVDSSNYTTGVNVTINAEQHTYIRVRTVLNSSLAGEGAEAESKTRLFINITGVVTDGELVQIDSLYQVSYWLVFSDYPNTDLGETFIPSASTSYTVSIKYQAYY
jgi:hypothetical protein